MGGYVRWDKDLLDDPRIAELADMIHDCFDVELTADPETTGGDQEFSRRDSRDQWGNALIGGLVRLWVHADTYIETGDKLPLSVSALSGIMRLPEWVVRLFPPDWLTVDDEHGCVYLPGYIDKNAIDSRDNRKDDRLLQREKWAQQKRDQRARRRAQASARVRKDTSTKSPPVRAVSTPLSTPHPVPVPGPLDRTRVPEEERETPTPPRGELASAVGRLARRDGPAKNGHGAPAAKGAPRPTKSREELDRDIKHLADDGLSSEDIARVLGQYGVSAADVRQTLGNRAPEGNA